MIVFRWHAEARMQNLNPQKTLKQKLIAIYSLVHIETIYRYSDYEQFHDHFIHICI